MELRKRKTPPPPPPPRVKRTKSSTDAKAEKPEKKAPAKRVKDAVVSKGEEVVKAVEEKTTKAPAKAAAAPKKSAAAEKKEAAAAEKKAAAEEKKAAAAAAKEEKAAEKAAAAAEKKASEKPAESSDKKEEPAAAAAAPAEEKKADDKPAEEKKEIKTLKVGDALPADLSSVKTDDGEDTTLTALLEKSSKGIIVFAYPSASTPGCTSPHHSHLPFNHRVSAKECTFTNIPLLGTKQACHFRDSHTAFTTAGYSIYGLSGDTPKKNKSFVTKEKLTYPLLCDTEYTLHAAFGIKKMGAKKATTERSVFAVSKDGKVALLEKGSPDGTWEAAKKFAGVE